MFQHGYKAAILLTTLSFSYSEPRIENFSEDKLVQYHYRYAVDELQRSGPLMDRWEQRLGEYVKGAYSVMQPDGRIRTVDYEVDGNKGYHAVIRMNKPGQELLSFQQLTQSNEVYPEAAIPSSIKTITPLALSSAASTRSDKLINYHSKDPYYNLLKSKKDHKPSATNVFTKKVLPTDKPRKVPLSPANYNAPQPSKLIHFRTPAGAIIPNAKFVSPVAITSEKAIEMREIHEPASSGLTEVVLPTERRRRNSRLVRRFKSFAEVFT